MPTHHRPIDARRHSCPGSSRHGSVSDLPRVFRLVALPRPMGALEAVRGNCPRSTWQTAPDRWKNSASESPLQWGEARGRACFIVIVGLESPPCLIGMDIMRPLRVHIDVTHGTATPAQPDPQTVHLNAAQSRQKTPGENGSATLETACPPQKTQQRKEIPLQGAEIPATNTARAPQSQPQRKKMPLLETDFAAVDTARPPHTQLQRMEMPLLDVDSPDMGAAFPPKFS